MESFENIMRRAERRLLIEVCSSLEDGVGYVCAAQRDPILGARVEGWVVGAAVGNEQPVFFEEAVVLFALRMVVRNLEGAGYVGDFIHVKAGSAPPRRGLLEQQNTGEVRLSSQAAPEIMQLCHKASKMLPCPMLYRPSGESWEYNQLRVAQLADLT